MDGLLAILTGFLAVLGVMAILLRLLGALLGLGLTITEMSAAASLAETSARRGDLTAMMERRADAAAMRRRRVRATAWVALWSALLVVPPLAGVGRLVYAAASVLWCLPRPRVRRRGPREEASAP